jgi:hypothetical protein
MERRKNQANVIIGEIRIGFFKGFRRFACQLQAASKIPESKRKKMQKGGGTFQRLNQPKFKSSNGVRNMFDPNFEVDSVGSVLGCLVRRVSVDFASGIYRAFFIQDNCEGKRVLTIKVCLGKEYWNMSRGQSKGWPSVAHRVLAPRPRRRRLNQENLNYLQKRHQITMASKELNGLRTLG